VVQELGQPGIQGWQVPAGGTSGSSGFSGSSGSSGFGTSGSSGSSGVDGNFFGSSDQAVLTDLLEVLDQAV
jgi:hypothetical protein